MSGENRGYNPDDPGKLIIPKREVPLTHEEAEQIRASERAHFKRIDDKRDAANPPQEAFIDQNPTIMIKGDALKDLRAKIQEIKDTQAQAQTEAVKKSGPEAGSKTAQIDRQILAEKPGIWTKAKNFLKGGK